MTRRWLLVLALVASVLLGAQAAYADDLGIQSVNTSSWPTVHIALTLPASAKGAAPSAVSVWENGVEIASPHIGRPQAAGQPVDVVLLMDVSGSMRDAPLADAQTAARNFAASMGPNDRIGVVAFGPTTRTMIPLSSDPAAVQAAINSLGAGGQTALYDGVVAASQLLPRDAARRRTIVLLSDGKDTVSSANLDDAVTAAKQAGAPVYAVGLKAPDADPKALNTIASATGGRLTNAKDSAALSGIFGALASELQQVYVVDYKSNKPNTPDLEVRLAVAGAAAPLTKTLFFSNPTFNASAQPFVTLKPRTPLELAEMFATQTGIIALTGVCVGLLGFVAAAALVRGKRPIDELAYYDQVHATGFENTPAAMGTVDTSRARVLGLVGQVAERRGFLGLARTKLERAGLPLRPNEYILLHVIGVLLVGFLAALILHNPLITLLGVVLATALPLAWLNHLENKRRTTFEEQLPDILMLMAGSLRAGWGLQQSIDLVVQQSAEPSVTEFGRVQAEVRLGLPLDQALYRLAERLDSDDFRWTASAIAIQREVGGNLAEVLEALAATMRERAALTREVSALTAEGRFSAIILAALPFFLAGALYFINPVYIGLLFNTPVGLTVLAFGFLLLVIGIIWLNRVVRIDV